MRLSQILKFTLHLKTHSSKGIEGGSEHRLCAQGITARANTASWGICTPSLSQLPSIYSVQGFPFLSLCLCFLSNRICPPFCDQTQKSFQSWCFNYRHSICTQGYCCSSFLHLPSVSLKKFVLNSQTLSWLQSTGQVLVPEWLWADAFRIAFHNRNFLFSSQKKWYPPFSSWTSVGT